MSHYRSNIKHADVASAVPTSKPQASANGPVTFEAKEISYVAGVEEAGMAPDLAWRIHQDLKPLADNERVTGVAVDVEKGHHIKMTASLSDGGKIYLEGTYANDQLDAKVHRVGADGKAMWDAYSDNGKWSTTDWRTTPLRDLSLAQQAQIDRATTNAFGHDFGNTRVVHKTADTDTISSPQQNRQEREFKVSSDRQKQVMKALTDNGFDPQAISYRTFPDDRRSQIKANLKDGNILEIDIEEKDGKKIDVLLRNNNDLIYMAQSKGLVDWSGHDFRSQQPLDPANLSAAKKSAMGINSGLTGPAPVQGPTAKIAKPH